MIVNDIDEEELKKPSVRSDMRVHADAKDLLEQLNLVLDRILAEEEGSLPESVSRPGGRQVFDGGKGLRDMTWSRTCAMWKEKYPVILPKHFAHTDEEPANVYAFIHAVSSRLKEGQVNLMVYAVYLLTCLSGGFLAGKRIRQRRFFWGLLSGLLYFLVLFAVSWAMNMGSAIDMERSVTVMGICALGGTIGGMLS